MNAKPLVVLLAAALLAGCGTVADPTTYFGGSSVEKPADLLPVPNSVDVITLWSVDVGKGVDKQRLNLVPKPAGGRVYAADGRGKVMALDAATGRNLWTRDTDRELSAGPGVGDGLVLVGTGDGEVVALDADSGAEKWVARVSSEVLAVPAAGRGVVVVHSIDGRIAGLDAATGKPRWQYERTSSGLGLRGASSPVITGSKVICGMAGGRIVALDLERGLPVWEATITAPTGRSELERVHDIIGDPLLFQGAVFVGTYQGEIAGLLEETGQIAWRRKASTHSALASDGRALYFTDDNDAVWSAEPRDGAALWKQDKLRARRLTAPAAVDGNVVVGDLEGYVHVLSAQDGSLVARTRVGSSPISAQPRVVDGVLYVLGDAGNLAAMRLGGATAR
jgi:outer membrane protein assembly factor BamB